MKKFLKISAIIIVSTVLIGGIGIGVLYMLFIDFMSISDKEIIQHVKKKYDFEVKIVENEIIDYGEEIIVEKNDGTQFVVYVMDSLFLLFVMTPELIRGDNYETSLFKTELEQKDDYNTFMKEVMALGFKKAELINEERLTLQLTPTIDKIDRNYFDDMLPKLFELTQFVVTFSEDKMDYIEIVTGSTDNVKIPVTKKPTSMALFTQELFDENDYLKQIVRKSDENKIIVAKEKIQPILDKFEMKMEPIPVKCKKVTTFQTCDSYIFNFPSLFDDAKKEVWKEAVFEVILVLQTTDLPVDIVIVDRVGNDYIIENIQHIDSIDDFELK